MRDLILQTKLQPPQIKTKILRRERLLNLLKKNLDKKLILLWAGAGYGKTTLFSQLIAETDISYTYYNLNHLDAEANRFFEHLIFSFRKSYPQFGKRTESILIRSSNFNQNAGQILTTFINESLLLTNHLVILDDFHTIKQAKWVKPTFDYLLTYLPSNIHFLISSREMPDFNLARLIAKQELLTITSDDLKFNDEEVRQLLSEIMSLKISEEQTKRLLDVSQGWITGIQLVLPQYPDDEKIKSALNGFLGSNQPLFDYFANEIFVTENRRTQQFLISISILDEICPEHCNALLNIRNAHYILKNLEKRNIFITATNEKTINYFQLHPLFREFLLRQLKTMLNDKRISILYEKIAQFFEKQNRIEDAIEYCLRGSNFKKAAQLIEKHAEKIILKGRTTALQNWILKIPDNIFVKHLWLYYIKATLLVYENRLDEALMFYYKALDIFKKHNNRKGLSRVFLQISAILCRQGLIVEAKREIKKAERYCAGSDIRQRILINNTKGMIANSSGEYNKVKKYLLEMLKLAHKLNEPSLLLLTHCNLGVFYTEKGDFRAANKEYEAAMRFTPKQEGHPRIGTLYANAAYTKIQRRSLDEARTLLMTAMNYSVSYNDIPSLITVFNILGDLYLETGDLKQSLEYYKKALSLALEKGEGNVCLSVYESLVYFYIRKNEPAIAKEYLMKLINGSLKKVYVNQHPFWLLLEAEIKIAEGNNEDAIKSLMKLLVIAQKKQIFHLIFKANLYLAFLYEILNKNIYLSYFNKAIKFSKKYDYSCFFYRNEKFLLFLKKIVEEGIIDKYVSEILLQEKQKNKTTIDREKKLEMYIKFLGIPEVYCDGNLVKNWISEKAKKLFCYFVLNNERKITKDEIIEAFWSDLGLLEATNNLSSTLYYIRKALLSQSHQRYSKEIIFYQEKTYFLDPELKVETDVKEFEHLVDELKIRKSMGKNLNGDGILKQAISKYQGQFGLGWCEPWFENLRTIYENIYLKLLLWAGEDAFGKKDFDNCFNYCKKLIAIDKYNESACCLLIRSLLSSGRKQEAMVYYGDFTSALNELDLTPGTELNLLKQQML